jgi:hypothetical protein
VKHQRLPKADLLRVIELAYGVGLGPKQVGAMTGYTRQYVTSFAASFGVRRGGNGKRKPREIPPELFVLLARHNAPGVR